MPTTDGTGTRFEFLVRAGIPLLLLLLAAISLLFFAFPEVDLWFSGLFFAAGKGFVLARVEPLAIFRRSGDVVVTLVVVLLVAQFALKLARPDRPSLVPPNAALFLLTTLAAGPGLLVNVVLKDNWGRPRPVMVEQFGGAEPYVEVWRITGHCLRNCSFVAGEASSAIWLTALALVAPKGWRLPVAGTTLAYAGLLSLNRIAFGAHFLSDVLLSWVLTLLVIAVAWRFMIERPPGWLDGSRLEDGLTRLGQKLRRRSGRSGAG
ncbi:MAG: phosphatase PAP2 family protein [Bauldia sp.]|nr:MAG: phosphatase PAP2 family protein [Bauldia sp.]MBZ0228330.1 phosphatase PAP2 family protein [Bauldia sp.]